MNPVVRKPRPFACIASIAALFGGLAAAQSVQVVETTADQSKLLQPQPNIAFSSGTGSNPTTVTINDSSLYQQMDGFGASLTDSAAYDIWYKLSTAQRNALMQTLFSPTTGIGISWLRQPMGASDFSSIGNYSYDDVPAGQTDQSLAHFSIAHDQTYIIPLLQQARTINPQVKIMALPWSPPAWMKTNGTMNGGNFNSSADSNALAQYFVKFIQAYQAQNVPIYAVAVQNEPLNSNSGYPTEYLAAADEGGFIGYNLGPALSSAGLATKIIAYDHNWDQPGYPESVLSNSAAYNYIAGTGWHCYAGDVSAQTTVHNAYPNKDAWFTECSGGSFSPDFATNLNFGVGTLLIGTTRNWAKSVTYWNLALDQNAGPTNGGCTDCRGVVTINNAASPSQIAYNIEYYVLGHAAKFVTAGANRVDSNTFGTSGIQDVAFKNTDGSLALIVMNSASSAKSFAVSWRGSNFSYTLPAGAAATFYWNPGIPSSSWYNLVNQNSGSCVDARSYGTANGTAVQQWACGNGQYNQEWQFQATDSGYYKVVNRNAPAQVWDVTNVGTQNGSLIQTYNYAGGTNQQWQPVSLGGGFYKFIARNSGRCLDTPSASTTNGVQLQIYDCNGTAAQSFRLVAEP